MLLSLSRTTLAPSTISPRKIMMLKCTIRLMNEGGVDDNSRPTTSLGPSSCGSVNRFSRAPIPRFALAYVRLTADGGWAPGVQEFGTGATGLATAIGGA